MSREEEWTPLRGTAFHFTVKACPELNHLIQWFGRDPEENPPPLPLRTWSIPVLVDSELTTVMQVFEFINRRLVSSVSLLTCLFASLTILCFAEQVNYCFKTPLTIYVIDTETQRRKQWHHDWMIGGPNNEMKRLLTTVFNGSRCDMLVDWKGKLSGAKMEFTDARYDSQCFCGVEMAQADRWYFPCRRHFCHLQCFIKMKVTNECRHWRKFKEWVITDPTRTKDVRLKQVLEHLLTLHPDGVCVTSQTFHEPVQPSVQCHVCRSAIEYPEPILRAQRVADQYKYAEAMSPEAIQAAKVGKDWTHGYYDKVWGLLKDGSRDYDLTDRMQEIVSKNIINEKKRPVDMFVLPGEKAGGLPSVCLCRPQERQTN